MTRSAEGKVALRVPDRISEPVVWRITAGVKLGQTVTSLGSTDLSKHGMVSRHAGKDAVPSELTCERLLLRREALH